MMSSVSFISLSPSALFWLISLPAIFNGIELNALDPGNTSYLLWMLMGFMLVTAVLVVGFGRLGDMYGKRRVLAALLVTMVVGSLISALSADVWGLILGRGLQGVTLATVPLGMAILRDVTRLWVWEPFARWKLTRDLRNSKRKKLALANGNGKANGNGAVNGNGHAAEYLITPAEKRKMDRSVMRFAEQGWSVIYYTFSWGFGVVRPTLLPPPSFADVCDPNGCPNAFANQLAAYARPMLRSILIEASLQPF